MAQKTKEPSRNPPSETFTPAPQHHGTRQFRTFWKPPLLMASEASTPRWARDAFGRTAALLLCQTPLKLVRHTMKESGSRFANSRWRSYLSRHLLPRFQREQIGI